jgi:hypothetical protein
VNDGLLADHLDIAIRLWIEKLADFSPEYRYHRAHVCAQALTGLNMSESLHYPMKETAEAFNRLAEGIACAAYQPGGIKCFGLHFQRETDG